MNEGNFFQDSLHSSKEPKQNKSEENIKRQKLFDYQAMRQLSEKMSHIKGWAIDANPDNDPTHPIRHRFDGDRSGYNWARPIQQRNFKNILHSNERPNVSSVFGTSTPASNLSGFIRRYAFRFSEGQYGHWLLLLLADRVNMVEGLATDILHGHVPHCLDERGIKAEWKYNRKAVVTRAAVGTIVIASFTLWLARKEKKRKNKTINSG